MKTESLDWQKKSTERKVSSLKELFYFAFADIMAKIEYQKVGNSLRYATHREITFDERFLIEQYLLANVAPKTEYYERQPGLFIYLGIDSRLVSDLKRFHSKGSLNSLAENENDVNTSVHGLIHEAMQTYYFERIGDTILQIRREIAQGKANQSQARLNGLRIEMEELLKAYNIYSNTQLTLLQVIPAELRSYFGIKHVPSEILPQNDDVWAS